LNELPCLIVIRIKESALAISLTCSKWVNLNFEMPFIAEYRQTGRFKRFAMKSK